MCNVRARSTHAPIIALARAVHARTSAGAWIPCAILCMQFGCALALSCLSIAWVSSKSPPLTKLSHGFWRSRRHEHMGLMKMAKNLTGIKQNSVKPKVLTIVTSTAQFTFGDHPYSELIEGFSCLWWCDHTGLKAT